VIRKVARTNVYNREQGKSGAEEMKREGGERREAKCRVCVRGVCYKNRVQVSCTHSDTWNHVFCRRTVRTDHCKINTRKFML
jgi:hypothetical protein